MGRSKGEETSRTLAALRNRIAAMERGTTTRIETSLGLPTGYLSKWWARNTFHYENLVRVLRFLEIDPSGFFAEAFQEGGDDSADGQAAAKPEPRRARPKLRPASGPETVVVPDWIEELDELRYHDAEAAIRQLWSRVDDVEGAAVAHYLGVLGSAYRTIGNLPEARECLHKAEARAVDDLGFGDALQRLSYLALYEGDAERALGLSEQAAGVFARGGLWPRFGEVHVDQAQYVFRLGSLEGLSRNLETAEERLAGAPESPRLRRYRFAIEQYRAIFCQESGRHADAIRFAQAAIRLAPDPLAQGYCWAQIGGALRTMGSCGEAAEAFLTSKALVAGHPVNVLSACIDAVHCLALAGRNREAIEEANTTANLVGSFSASSPIRAATLALWTQARRRWLAVAQLGAVRDAISEERSSKRTPAGLGRRLARIRRLAGASRDAVSAGTGTPAATLRALEAGKCSAAKHSPAIERWIRASRPESRL